MLDGKVAEETRKNIVADLEDMNAIIDQFIDFARSEATEPLSPVNLSEVARVASERAARTGARIQCEPGPVPMLMLRPLAIQRLADNLVGNALRHAGGLVEVSTAATRTHATLSVMDRGPGIAAELIGRLKEPFTRMDAARSGQSGAGLGLAIAQRIATLHGGLLELLPREGGGLEARLTLPISA